LFQFEQYLDDHVCFIVSVKYISHSVNRTKNCSI
jgi:hypothetical protein